MTPPFSTAFCNAILHLLFLTPVNGWLLEYARCHSPTEAPDRAVSYIYPTYGIISVSQVRIRPYSPIFLAAKVWPAFCTRVFRIY